MGPALPTPNSSEMYEKPMEYFYHQQRQQQMLQQPRSRPPVNVDIVSPRLRLKILVEQLLNLDRIPSRHLSHLLLMEVFLGGEFSREVSFP